MKIYGLRVLISFMTLHQQMEYLNRPKSLFVILLICMCLLCIRGQSGTGTCQGTDPVIQSCSNSTVSGNIINVFHSISQGFTSCRCTIKVEMDERFMVFNVRAPPTENCTRLAIIVKADGSNKTLNCNETTTTTGISKDGETVILFEAGNKTSSFCMRISGRTDMNISCTSGIFPSMPSTVTRLFSSSSIAETTSIIFSSSTLPPSSSSTPSSPSETNSNTFSLSSASGHSVETTNGQSLSTSHTSTTEVPNVKNIIIPVAASGGFIVLLIIIISIICARKRQESTKVSTSQSNMNPNTNLKTQIKYQYNYDEHGLRYNVLYESSDAVGRNNVNNLTPGDNPENGDYSQIDILSTENENTKGDKPEVGDVNRQDGLKGPVDVSSGNKLDGYIPMDLSANKTVDSSTAKPDESNIISRDGHEVPGNVLLPGDEIVAYTEMDTPAAGKEEIHYAVPDQNILNNQKLNIIVDVVPSGDDFGGYSQIDIHPATAIETSNANPNNQKHSTPMFNSPDDDFGGYSKIKMSAGAAKESNVDRLEEDRIKDQEQHNEPNVMPLGDGLEGYRQINMNITEMKDTKLADDELNARPQEPPVYAKPIKSNKTENRQKESEGPVYAQPVKKR